MQSIDLGTLSGDTTLTDSSQLWLTPVVGEENIQILERIQLSENKLGGLKKDHFECIDHCNANDQRDQLGFLAQFGMAREQEIYLWLDGSRDRLYKSRWKFLPDLWEQLASGDHSIVAADFSWHMFMWSEITDIEFGARWFGLNKLAKRFRA